MDVLLFRIFEHVSKSEKRCYSIFSIDDVLVFAYVSNHWEDEPDFECIKMGLNAKEHYEYPYNELATVLTLIFREIPHDIEERSASAALVVALSEFTDLYFIANSYKNAGDVVFCMHLRRFFYH